MYKNAASNAIEAAKKHGGVATSASTIKGAAKKKTAGTKRKSRS